MSGLEVAATIAGYAVFVGFAAAAFLSLGELFGWVPQGASRRFDDATDLPYGVACLVLAMWHAYLRNWVLSVLLAALAAWALRRWWNGRGRKRAARLAARVRDLGHRLVVVPATGGAR